MNKSEDQTPFFKKATVYLETNGKFRQRYPGQLWSWLEVVFSPVYRAAGPDLLNFIARHRVTREVWFGFVWAVVFVLVTFCLLLVGLLIMLRKDAFNET